MMNSTKEISIPLSKSKIVLMLLASLAFVVTGAFFVMKPQLFDRYPTIIVQIIGVVAILFFGAAGIIGFKKLFQTKPGLIINDAGIIDASSGVSLGMIKKDDIIGIRKAEVMSTKFLLIDIHNPESYIDKAPNTAAKKLLKINHNTYGTPLSINSNALKIKFAELEKILTEYVNLESVD